MTSSTTRTATPDTGERGSPADGSRQLRADRAQSWEVAEAHIIGEVSSLTIWEAERWAAAYEHQLPKISLMAHRVSYMQASGGSPELDYLLGAFDRIDAAVLASSWAQTFGEGMAASDRVGDRTQAATETMAAVNAVARCALTAVVLTDELAPSTSHG